MTRSMINYYCLKTIIISEHITNVLNLVSSMLLIRGGHKSSTRPNLVKPEKKGNWASWISPTGYKAGLKGVCEGGPGIKKMDPQVPRSV